MRKLLTTLALTCAMCLSLSANVFAADYVANDITYQNLNGQQMAVKTYTLLPDQDPADLIEQDFEMDGYLYSYSDTVKKENTFLNEEEHTETVSVNTASKSLEKILEKLDPTMEYEKDGARGTLHLDHSSIETKVAGYRNSNKTVTATKNYTGLARNDSSLIDKTVTKEGRTLSLSNVAWSVESTALVGDELVPATYAATATYTGNTNSSVPTGYITTADYVGTVAASGVSSIEYTVTYLGDEVENSAIEALLSSPEGVFGASIAGLAGILLLIGLLRRNNCTVYEETGDNNEYAKCGRLRIKKKNPELRIDRMKRVPSGMIAVEIEERTAKKLFGQRVLLRYYDRTLTHVVGKTNGAYWFKIDLGEAADEEDKEAEV